MRYLISLLLLLTLASCSRSYDPVVARMQTRTMQTRTFAGHNAKSVAKEIIAVLQDEGFMIKTVNQDLGLLTAERDTDIEKTSSKFWAHVFSGKSAARWKKRSLIEMTTSITEGEGRCNVRINLLLRTYDNLGRVLDVHQVVEDKAYIDFFNKVQKGLLGTQG